MPNNLAKAFALPNLRRAWKWMATNPEPQFKNYVRHIYRAYSLCAEENLADLNVRLTKGIFVPQHSTKLFFPKKSGILRPYSLLCIEDQIVYQAMVNVVAESFPDHIRRRYQKQVFGHLYAGKRSRVFYKSWKSAYAKFSEAMRKAFADGYLYTASFDLTACYDSIDHRVIKHFLLDLKLEPEFCDYLCELLRTWTSSSSSVPIYQGHGIPQGPPPSGLLSECVLRHFDDNGPASKAIRYFRYVDDIRLFAKSEKAIRKRLILLDRISKEVGLFPQSSKIDIHKVKDIDSEIKTISNPPEIILEPPHPDQKKIRRRIAELTPRLTITNETRLKYVLGRAAPSAGLTKRLLKILERSPHLYVAVSHYLMRADRLSSGNSRQCLQLAKAYDLYPAFTAALLTALRGRVHPSCQLELIRHCKSLLIADPDRYEDPELEVAAISILLEGGVLTWSQTRFHVLKRKDWWVRSEIIRYVQEDLIGGPSYEYLLNGLLRDKTVDVSLVGADFLIAEGGEVSKPRTDINKIAQLALRAAGMISRVSGSSCPISEAMIAILDPSLAVIDWRKLLGASYLSTIPKIIRWRGYATTDSTAWVNISDTINDVILSALYKKDGTIGTYVLGSIGSVLTPGPGNRFMTKYPKLYDAVAATNGKRKESDLSHPITRLTGRPTRHIRFSELPALKRAQREGYLEMWSVLGL